MSTALRVCSLADLPDGQVRRVVPAGGPPLVLVRTGGRVHALRDTCSHQDCPLSDGELYEGSLECALHGSLFDLTTGAPDGPPATRAVPVHAVRLEGDEVLVEVTPSSAPVPGAPLPEGTL